MKYPIRKLSIEKKKNVNLLIEKIKNKEISYEGCQCPICNSTKTDKIFTNDRYGIPIHLGICVGCGFVYENPVFDDKSLMEFYSSNEYREIYGGMEKDIFEKRFKFDDSLQFDPDVYHANESFFKFIESTGVSFKSILEIGSGGGWNATPFINNGYEYKGIEPTKSLVEKGKERGVNLVYGFLRDVKEKYDMIMMRHVLEHLKHPVEDLKYLSKYTNKIAIEIPGFINRVPSIQNAHTFYFSVNTLKKVSSLAGFKISHLAVFDKNEFIMAILEKEDNSNFDYSFKQERSKVKKVVKKYYIKSKIKRLLGK